MKSDLEDLKITEKEIEKLTGLEINGVFIGGVLGGTYNPSVLLRPKQLASLCLTEIFVLVLIFIFTIPIGIPFLRNSVSVVNSPAVNSQFLQTTIVVTSLVFTSWNIYMWLRLKRIKILARLLDEIEKYNEIIQSVYLFDKLGAVGNLQNNLVNRNEVVEALNVTRDTLVCGLITEKILRENRGLLARRHDLFANIENNLTTLRALDVKNQANEYGQLLNNALQISMSVRKEMLKLSHPSEVERF